MQRKPMAPDPPDGHARAPRPAGDAPKVRPERGSITRLIDPLRAGDPDAQRRLVERFFAELRGQIERARASTRGIADAEDATSEALCSFLLRIRGGQFPELRDRDQLRALLWTIASRKLDRYARDEHAMKRGGGQVVHLGDDGPVSPDASDDPPALLDGATVDRLDLVLSVRDLLSDHDDPGVLTRFEARVIELALEGGFEETTRLIESALAPLEDELRELFLLHRGELTRAEIARRLGVSESGVKRRSRKLRAAMILAFRLDGADEVSDGPRGGADRGGT